MSNIILIGMPSCGKSTVGVLLAKQLGYRFLDTDLLIQERTGKLLHELIAKWGNDGFLSLENEILSSIETDKTVIATGGSAVYGREAMERFKQNGTAVYLKIDFQTLSARLGDYVHRGVVMPTGGTLKDLYDERHALYEKYADQTLDESLCAGIGETVARLCELLEKKLTKWEVER